MDDDIFVDDVVGMANVDLNEVIQSGKKTLWQDLEYKNKKAG